MHVIRFNNIHVTSAVFYRLKLSEDKHETSKNAAY